MEIEAKFTIPDEGTFRRLLAATALGEFDLAPPARLHVCDRYLDTASGAIRAAGFACRLRREDGRFLAGVKGLGGASGALHRRDEYEQPLPGPLPPADWPSGPVRDLVLRLIGNQPLICLFEIEQERHMRGILDAGRTLAQLSLDRIAVGRDGAVAATYLELEAELLPAEAEHDLERLAAEIEGAWGLAPQPCSKFERGLALFGPASTLVEEATGAGQRRRLKLDPDEPMSAAGRKVLRHHFERMVAHEPGVRLGEDVEALHDMRVATRRMRAAFRVFDDFYQAKTIAPYLKGLKRTGRALGPVRDLDVLDEKIRADREAQPALQAANLDELFTAVEARRQEARQVMLRYLEGAQYARFKARFRQFLDTDGLGSRPIKLEGDGQPSPYRVRHVVPAAIYERLAAVRAYDEWVRIPDPPLERLHALRIACKRLRYTLEFFLSTLGPEARQAIETVIAVQDHLGALQDAVVASGFLREFLTQAALPQPGVETYLALKEQARQDLVDTFPQAWQQLTGSEFSRMVAQAVAVL